MKKIKILIADDHAMFRQGLRKVLSLERDMEIVGEAENGVEAIQLAKKLKPDIVIMDIKLPQINGLEATQMIKKVEPDIGIIILSMYEDEAHILEGVQSGASGYMLKRLPVEELAQAIRTVHEKGVFIHPATSAKLLRGVKAAGLGRFATKKLSRLTRKEIKVLNLIAQGKINKEIAQELFMSEQTVKTHLNHMYQ